MAHGKATSDKTSGTELWAMRSSYLVLSGMAMNAQVLVEPRRGMEQINMDFAKRAAKS